MPGSSSHPGLSGLARTHVVDVDLEAAYAGMAADEAREAKALEWSEGLLHDVADEPGTTR